MYINKKYIYFCAFNRMLMYHQTSFVPICGIAKNIKQFNTIKYDISPVLSKIIITLTKAYILLTYVFHVYSPHEVSKFITRIFKNSFSINY